MGLLRGNGDMRDDTAERIVQGRSWERGRREREERDRSERRQTDEDSENQSCVINGNCLSQQNAHVCVGSKR